MDNFTLLCKGIAVDPMSGKAVRAECGTFSIGGETQKVCVFEVCPVGQGRAGWMFSS